MKDSAGIINGAIEEFSEITLCEFYSTKKTMDWIILSIPIKIFFVSTLFSVFYYYQGNEIK